jgi:hypothetical protein
MKDDKMDRIALLERRQRFLFLVNTAAIGLLAFFAVGPDGHAFADQNGSKILTVSEISIVDSHGTVRARIGGNLPDAVIKGKVTPRGQRAAGLLLYDEAGQERGGYVTWGPSNNVGLTLDGQGGQAAEFVAGPEGGSAIRLHWADDAVELRADDEDGPSIHAVQRKVVVFHEPPVQNPKSTAMCKALTGAKGKYPIAQLFDACRARSSEAACQACLGK